MNQLCHWEIPSTDLKKSGDFYKKMFGWKLQQWIPEYLMFEAKGGIGGGITKVKKMPKACITVYIEVANIPVALAKATKLGAEAVMPKTLIAENVGYMAFLEDPCGCKIGLWAKK